MSTMTGLATRSSIVNGLPVSHSLSLLFFQLRVTDLQSALTKKWYNISRAIGALMLSCLF